MRTDPFDRIAALAEADRHGGGGRDRLRKLVDLGADAGKLSVVTFDEPDREAFLNTAWQEINETRYLTPANLPRTLRAVGARVYTEFGTFAELIARGSRAGLDPGWFAPCAEIERAGFRWDGFLMPWLVPAVADERRHSPDTALYVYEGVHSTAVLALALLRGDVAWAPVRAVVCSERPA